MNALEYQPLIWTLICLAELWLLLKQQLIEELVPIPFLVGSIVILWLLLRNKLLSAAGLSELMSWLFGTAVLLVIAFLFGAPPNFATCTFATAISAIVWIPASMYLRIDSFGAHGSVASVQPLAFYFDSSSPMLHAWPGVLAMLGAYLGAAAIPLDWDRWWQRWPLPCLIGALAGFPIGHLAAKVSTFLLTH